jgi:hypothetical protein
MKKLLRAIKLTVGNHSYQLRFLKNGTPYIVKTFSSRGFNQWKNGKIENGSGIISK